MSAPGAVATRGLEADYAELRRTVVGAGLLERRYGYYALRGGTSFALLAVAAAIPFLLRPAPWVAQRGRLPGSAAARTAKQAVEGRVCSVGTTRSASRRTESVDMMGQLPLVMKAQ